MGNRWGRVASRKLRLMSSVRAKLILMAAAAVLAAAHANWAWAGYIPVIGSHGLAGSEAGLFAVADFSGACEQSAGATPPSPGVPSGPTEDRHNGQRDDLRVLLALPTHGAGATSSPSSSTGPSGSASVALAAALPSIPDDSMIGLLPNEMGPTFCNPPPWKPLHPPRDKSGNARDVVDGV